MPSPLAGPTPVQKKKRPPSLFGEKFRQNAGKRPDPSTVGRVSPVPGVSAAALPRPKEFSPINSQPPPIMASPTTIQPFSGRANTAQPAVTPPPATGYPAPTPIPGAMTPAAPGTPSYINPVPQAASGTLGRINFGEDLQQAYQGATDKTAFLRDLYAQSGIADAPVVRNAGGTLTSGGGGQDLARIAALARGGTGTSFGAGDETTTAIKLLLEGGQGRIEDIVRGSSPYTGNFVDGERLRFDSPDPAGRIGPPVDNGGAGPVGGAGPIQGAGDTGISGLGGGPNVREFTAANNLRNQQITPGGGPSRTDLAQRTFDLIREQGDRGFQADLRRVGQNAAKFGRIGAGLTTSELGDVSARREESLSQAARDLGIRAADAGISDARSNRDELRTERGFQDTLAQRAIDNALRQTFAEDALTNSQFGREQQVNQLLAQLGAGGTGANDLLGAEGLLPTGPSPYDFLSELALRRAGQRPAPTSTDPRFGNVGT